VRGTILKIHLALALIAGTFMVILGVTGSIMHLEPQLDRLLHPNLWYVKPYGRVLTLVEIGDAVSRKYVGEPVVAYLPSRSPRFPTEVILSRGVVAVNQYTGEVLGVREMRGPWWSGRFWFDVHNSVGIFSLVPLLALAATGIH
jgi:uncharacterized iron-regulated membrane protein